MLRNELPAQIIAAARDPYAARAIVLTLLLNEDSAVRSQQLQSLCGLVKPDLCHLVQQLMPSIDQLDVRLRLPLVDVALPALAAMSQSQYAEFIQAFEALALADGQLDLFEWVLSQIVIRHLRPKFENVRRTIPAVQSLQKLQQECGVVLSAVAYGGNTNDVAAKAFASSSKHFPEVSLQFVPREKCQLDRVRMALAALSSATSTDQGRIVDACASSISADGHATLEEVEMLRGISDLLNCPMPPLLVPMD